MKTLSIVSAAAVGCVAAWPAVLHLGRYLYSGRTTKYHPDLHGKTALVTGAASGLGYATAKHLISLGCHVIVHDRTQPRVDAAVAQLKRESGSNSIEGLVADISSLKSMNTGLTKFIATHDVVQQCWCSPFHHWN